MAFEISSPYRLVCFPCIHWLSIVVFEINFKSLIFLSVGLWSQELFVEDHKRKADFFVR